MSFKSLEKEYDAKLIEWRAKQTPLAVATDILNRVNAQMEEELLNRIYNRMNPFNQCGKFDLRFMEETFGYTEGRSMFIHNAATTKEQIDEQLRRHNEEDFGQPGDETEIS